MKRTIAFLLAVLVLSGISVAAAAVEVPDLTQEGTITFAMSWNGSPLDSGSLLLCRVGDVLEDDGDYCFALIDALEGHDVSLDDLDDPNLARELVRIVKAESLAAVTAPITGGEARFSDVAPGLYVVMQEESDASEGFAAISPFLISMPKYENGHYETNITATPKVPLVTAPTQPTQQEPALPPDPSLPQTGQLNWPIPVLTVSGLALFALGWFLCFGRRKEADEK